MLKKLKWAIMPVVAIAMVAGLSAYIAPEEGGKKKGGSDYCYNSDEELVKTITTCDKGDDKCTTTSCPPNTHTHP